jgi:hypothetical protein
MAKPPLFVILNNGEARRDRRAFSFSVLPEKARPEILTHGSN